MGLSNGKVMVEKLHVQRVGGGIRSYTGKDLAYQQIEIEVYNKFCASPSLMTIRLEENSTKGRRNVISCQINKLDLLQLRDILNTVEL